jgi:hypothetical protein
VTRRPSRRCVRTRAVSPPVTQRVRAGLEYCAPSGAESRLLYPPIHVTPEFSLTNFLAGLETGNMHSGMLFSAPIAVLEFRRGLSARF